MRSNHSPRLCMISVCEERETNCRSDSMSRHTDRLIAMFSFSNGRIAVASPASVCSRHTKPREASAIA